MQSAEVKEVMVDDFIAFAGEDVIASVSFIAFLAMSVIFSVFAMIQN